MVSFCPSEPTTNHPSLLSGGGSSLCVSLEVFDVFLLCRRRRLGLFAAKINIAGDDDDDGGDRPQQCLSSDISQLTFGTRMNTTNDDLDYCFVQKIKNTKIE